MTDFFDMVRGFLNDYLPKQKCYSENTVRSYRQVLRLLTLYLRTEKRLRLKNVKFSTFDRNLILDFLGWLETSRGCGVNSLNHRLMVLRSFFDYAGTIDCSLVSLSLKVNEVPIKTGESKVVEYLSETALESLLAQPNSTKRTDMRNLFFMVLMYDSAARCGELLNLKIRDLRIDVQHPIIYLHGKGAKTRTTPLLERTLEHCRRYLREFHPNADADSNEYVFYTVSHGVRHQMSADAVARFFDKYAKTAHDVCKEVPPHVHPHMLRHTRAMHLYQKGMPIHLLSETLGHVNEETTRIYAYADTEMKREVMDKTDVLRNGAPPPKETWADDDDTIMILSGLA